MILQGDAWALAPTLEPGSIQTIVTSPPYWGLRDYGEPGQFGLEPTPERYVSRLVELFGLLLPALREDGTVWLNLGDTYCSQGGSQDGASMVWRNASGRADGIVDERGQRNRNGNAVPGLRPKNLVGIPWRVAFALQAEGWYLRQDIIWQKPNPMPEAVTDRCTKAHEYVFLLSQKERYYYDAEAVEELGAEPGRSRNDRIGGANGHTVRHSAGGMMGASSKRNRRSVWTIATEPYPEAHFATFPRKLPELCILAGTRPGDTVLDPFLGSGTTGMVAAELGREFVGMELNPEYCALAERRIAPAKAQGLLTFMEANK